MLTASKVNAEISLSAVPVLKGAAECIQAGLISSIHPENLRFRHSLQNPDQPPPILFDPQTAGGLLAGIPAPHAEPCLAELRKLGYASARLIGQIAPTQGLPQISVTR